MTKSLSEASGELRARDDELQQPALGNAAASTLPSVDGDALLADMRITSVALHLGRHAGPGGVAYLLGSALFR